MSSSTPDQEQVSTEHAIRFLIDQNTQLTQSINELRQSQQASLQNQQTNSQTSSLSKYGIKPPKPDVFKGPSVDLFIFSMEKAFDYFRVEEQDKVRIAITYFREAALRWVQYLETTNQVSSDWNQFKALMIQHFKASNTETIIRNKLNSLRQQASVNTYNDLFNKLIIELPTVDEKTKVDMYCRGLKPSVHLHVSLSNPSNLIDAQTTAMNVDNIFSATYHKRNTTQFQPRNYSQATHNTISTSVPMELGHMNQHQDETFDQVNHMRTSSGYKGNNKLNPEQIKQLMNERKCFRCRRVGHIAKHCDQTKNV